MSLLDLPNLGETSRARLEEVGIRNRRQLERVGPAGAYQRLVAVAGRRLPVCYYLYALDAALRGVDWRSLSDREKAELRRQAGVD